MVVKQSVNKKCKYGCRKKPLKYTTKKPAKSFAKAVKAVIHAQAESKQAFHSHLNVNYNSGMDSAGDQTRIVPNVIQGISECERIGEQIRAQKLTLKGHYLLNYANNSVANARIAVRMMIVQPRIYGTIQDVTGSTAWLGQLLVKGATATAFTGIVSDLYANINSDAIIKYYDKVTYLSMPYVSRTTTTGVTSVNTATESVVDMSQSVRFFNISLKVKNKLLKYDKAWSSTQPMNYAPCLLVGYVHLDGSAPDVATTQLNLNFDSYLTYEDM